MERRFSFVSAALLISALLRCFLLVRGQCDDGRCVAIAQCQSNVGEHFIDLRIGNEAEGECNHYLEVCCDEADIVEEPGLSEPDKGRGEPDKGGGEPGNTSARPVDLKPREFGRCGIRNPDGIGFRVVNAADGETEFAEFPWMVALMENTEMLDKVIPTYICGGSLIAPNVVLTAAHCVHKKEAAALTARAGEWDTKTVNEVRPYQERNIQQIIIQPHYNSATHFNNIALLVTEQPFTADDNVQLICLPPQGRTFTDHNCFSTGWGKSNFESTAYQVILKKVLLPMVSFKECQDALRRTRLGASYRLHNSYTCAGGREGEDTCTGDGGSPLMCPFSGSESRYYQAGIVAWGIGCGNAGVPGVYTKSSLYTDWIKEELEKLQIFNDIENDY